MMQTPYRKFALVIPTLNEAGTIKTVLDRAIAALSEAPTPWEILVVDDGSSDGTDRIVSKYTESESRVRLLPRRGTRGLAGAITYGWAQTDADLIGVMDADLQHPPELLPNLISRVCNGCDIAIASRYVERHSMDDWSPARKAISRLSVLLSMLVQRRELKVRDSMSGFFVVRRDCIDGLSFQSTGFKLLLEILAKGRIGSVAEIPFKFGARSHGRSKTNGMTAVHYLLLLYKLLLEAAFRKRNAGAGGSQADDLPGMVNEQTIAEQHRSSTVPTRPARSLEVILGLLPLVLGLQLLIWVVYLPVALHGNADFRNLYTAGVIVRSGQSHQLYNYELQKQIQDSLISESPNVLPYVHLPYEALLFVPLSLLSYRNAFLCFLGFNLLCLFLGYRTLRGKLGRMRILWRWFPFLFVIAFAPVGAALMQGQDSILTLLLLATALASLEFGEDAMAGFLIGLAMFKFQLVLPIAALFFLWRRWRFVLGASISILITLAVSALVTGLDGMTQYVRSLRNISTTFSVGGHVLYLMPVSRMPNLRGLILAIPHLPSGIAKALIIVLSCTFFVLAAWSGRKAPAPWQLAIAVSAAAVIGYHVLTHDLSILLIPMTMLLNQPRAQGLWTVSLVWLSTPFCFFAYDNLVALPILGLFLFLIWQLRHGPGILDHGVPATGSVLSTCSVSGEPS